jgi:hypothetical protein
MAAQSGDMRRALEACAAAVKNLVKDATDAGNPSQKGDSLLPLLDPNLLDSLCPLIPAHRFDSSKIPLIIYPTTV